MLRYIFIVCCLFLMQNIVAQNSDWSTEKTQKYQRFSDPKTGEVNYYASPEIESLVGKNRYVHQQKNQEIGYRIQLIQSTDRNKVLTTRAQFSSQFPRTKSYLDYQQPYFKLRVGNFANRLEAYKFYREIREDFNRAFIVQSKIPKSILFAQEP